jgi:regulator of RNase E activity RraA
MYPRRIEIPWKYQVLARERRSIPAEVLPLLTRHGAVEDLADGLLNTYGLHSFLNFPAGTRATRDFGVRAGPVLTAIHVPRRTHERDDRKGHEIVAAAVQPGDVVVIDAHACKGITSGGNKTRLLLKAGASACVIEGAVRDYDEIELPTIATALQIEGGRRYAQLSLVGGTINFRGTTIQPDDVALVNAWGMTLIPAQMAWEQVVEILGTRKTG